MKQYIRTVKKGQTTAWDALKICSATSMNVTTLCATEPSFMTTLLPRIRRGTFSRPALRSSCSFAITPWKLSMIRPSMFSSKTTHNSPVCLSFCPFRCPLQCAPIGSCALQYYRHFSLYWICLMCTRVQCSHTWPLISLGKALCGPSEAWQTATALSQALSLSQQRLLCRGSRQKSATAFSMASLSVAASSCCRDLLIVLSRPSWTSRILAEIDLKRKKIILSFFRFVTCTRTEAASATAVISAVIQAVQRTAVTAASLPCTCTTLLRTWHLIPCCALFSFTLACSLSEYLCNRFNFSAWT